MIEKIEEAVRVAARQIILDSDMQSPVALDGSLVSDRSRARTVTIDTVSSCAQDYGVMSAALPVE